MQILAKIYQALTVEWTLFEVEIRLKPNEYLQLDGINISYNNEIVNNLIWCANPV